MIHGLDAVILIVKDLERQKAFYRDVLGLPLESDLGDAAFFACGRQKLALFAPSHHPQGTKSLEGAAKGISHLEFRIARDQLAPIGARLREAGFHAYRDNYRDADGNLFHFNVDDGAAPAEYPLRDFPACRGLRGIPDGLVEAHLKLYAGYVSHTNLLRRKLAEHPPGAPEWCEMQRRLGFEIDGMRLHELYFSGLTPGGQAPSADLRSLLSATWGSFDGWRAEFTAIGKMRGIGWAILYRDPATGMLSNHWIGLHEEGHPAGFTPVLVMDVWEHAYTGMERLAYIDAFLANADWAAAGARL